MPAVARPQVMENRSAPPDGRRLGPDLGGYEGSQDPAQQAAVAEHPLRVGAQHLPGG